LKDILIAGAGTMGNGIAHVFALADFRVFLFDISPTALAQASKEIQKNLHRQVNKEVISEQKSKQAFSTIHFTSNWKEANPGTALVIEAISENISLKQSLFQEFDSHFSNDTIFASNTSAISITSLASVVSNPQRFIGLHFMNPVPVMSLVEIIKAHQTSLTTIERSMELVKNLNKTPIFSEDFPGFLSNRILMPLINEAIYTLHDGVGNAESIDQVMKLGMGHPMGPLQLADIIGLDICLSIMNVLYEGFKNPKYAPCPLLVKMVNAGELGKKSGKGFYDYSSAPVKR